MRIFCKSWCLTVNTRFCFPGAENDKGYCRLLDSSLQRPARRRFFRRRERKTSEEPKPEPEEVAQKIVKKQALTFKFPSAPQAFADEEEVDDPYTDNVGINAKATQTQDEQPNKEEKSTDESSSISSDDEERKKESDRENFAPPNGRQQTRDGLNAAPTNSFRNETHPRLSDSRAEASAMMKEYTSKRLEGHGSQLEPDTPLSGFSRMLKRLRGPEMKSMKIATEDTKDERTLGETVTHVLQVALVPEVYAEDMEGEGNLGFYRPVCSTTPRSIPPSQLSVTESVKYQKENVVLKKKVAALRGHVTALEETIKSKDLEATVWKVRAQELEYELRTYKGHNDDNSATEPKRAHPENEFESEIDPEWDTLQESEGDVSQDQHESEKKSEEIESGDEDGETDGLTEDVKEGVLVDTSIVPEPFVFDPLAATSHDEDATDEDKLFHIVASLGEDVEASQCPQSPSKPTVTS